MANAISWFFLPTLVYCNDPSHIRSCHAETLIEKKFHLKIKSGEADGSKKYFLFRECFFTCSISEIPELLIKHFYNDSKASDATSTINKHTILASTRRTGSHEPLLPQTWQMNRICTHHVSILRPSPSRQHAVHDSG